MRTKYFGSVLLLILLATSLIAILSFGMTPQTASANPGPGDWSMFRHDLEHTGYTTDVGPAENSLLWSYITGYYVQSSPAVAGGRVYVGSWDGKVYCLNADDGSRIWSYATGSNVSSSPAVAGGRVYVGSWNGNVYCLNADNGDLIWSYTTSYTVESSPAVAGGRVYVGSDDGNVYCLNADDGSRIWFYKTNSYSVVYSPAVVGSRVYIGSSNGKVYCLNADDGSLIWSYEPPFGGVWSSPAVVNGRLYVGSAGFVYCLNADDNSLIWRSGFLGGASSSPAVAGGRVYVGCSWPDNVYCLNADDGSRIWSYETGNYVNSSPAVANGMVYVGSLDGKVYCFNADSGSLIWSYTTGDMVYSSPAVAGGRVYVGSDDDKVYCFGAAQVTNPDFTISVSPTSGSENQVGSTTTTVSLSPINGFSSAVSLSASGLPAGANATFNPSSITPGASSTLTISTIATTPTGTYTVTITGTGGGITHTCTYKLTVSITTTTTSSTSVSCSPNPVSVGSPVTCTATVSGSNPTGTVSWSTSSSTGSFSTPICTLSAGSCSTTYTDTSAGSVTITANYSWDANNAPSSASVTLTVSAPSLFEFTVYTSGNLFAVNGGGSVDVPVSVDLVSGPTESVSLSVAWIPTGSNQWFTTSFTPSSGDPSFTSTLAIMASNGTPAGTYTAQILASAGGKVESTNITIAVNPQLEVIGYSTSPTTPVEGQSFTIYLDVKNTSNSALSPPDHLIVQSTNPGTDPQNQTPYMSYVGAASTSPKTINPNQQVTLVYLATAYWNFAKPPTFWDTFNGAFRNWLLSFLLKTTQVAAESYALNVLSYPVGTGSQTTLAYYILKDDVETSGALAGATISASKVLAGIANIQSSGMILPVVGYTLSFPSGQTIGEVAVVASQSKIDEAGQYIIAKIAALGISSIFSVAAISTSWMASTLVGAVVPGACIAIAALAGPITDAWYQTQMSDPDNNYTKYVTLPITPTILSSLPADNYSQLLYYEYEYYVNMNASVASSDRAYGALQENAFYYALMQEGYAENYALEASSYFSEMVTTFNTVLNQLNTTGRFNSTAFQEGKTIVSSGLPENIKNLLEPLGILQYVDTTSLLNTTYEEINLSTPVTLPNTASYFAYDAQLRENALNKSNSQKSGSSPYQEIAIILIVATIAFVSVTALMIARRKTSGHK